MKAIWRRVGNAAVPADENALAALHAHKDGSEFLAETKAPRNLKQLKLFWALCNVVAENDTTYNTKEKAKEQLLMDLRYVDCFFHKDGTMHVRTKSIAFESMEQAVFNELFQNAVVLVCQWIGTKPKEVIDRVNDMIADRRYEGMMR